MKFISLFSGIGGFDLGLENAGMTCTAQVEIDQNASKILARHYPDVLHLEDIKNAGKYNLPTCDLICGGFPCQDVSVAGKKAGLSGTRSGLWFEFLRILKEINPEWVIIENVPGLLSSNKGRDFATVLNGLSECGYNAEWRVLDAQYYGVAQRRKRVFIVGHIRGKSSKSILFDTTSSIWGFKESRQKRENLAAAITHRIGKGGFTDPVNDNIVGTLSASGAGTERTGNERTESEMLVVSYNVTMNDANGTRKDRLNGGLYVNETNKANTLTVVQPGIQTTVVNEYARRLTPLECERLQGFPDGWTQDQRDAVRYRQLGNAVCVPVAQWLGNQIMKNGS